jgi:hypothetical protein
VENKTDATISTFLSSDLFGQSENLKTRQKAESQNYCKTKEKKRNKVHNNLIKKKSEISTRKVEKKPIV